MPFGFKRKDDPPPPRDDNPPPGILSDGRHWVYVMNADGTRSTTKGPCACPIGAEHDGPIPGE